jgi:hypothetical protein
MVQREFTTLLQRALSKEKLCLEQLFGLSRHCPAQNKRQDTQKAFLTHWSIFCNYLKHRSNRFSTANRRKKQPWRRHKTVARPKAKGLIYVRGEGGKLQK